MRWWNWFILGFGGGGGGSSAAAQQAIDLEKQEAAAKEALRGKVNLLFDSPEAQARRATENQALTGALRGQYGQEQQEAYDKARRGLLFSAGETGQFGGSEYATKLAKLEEANRKVGTNIGLAEQRALNEKTAAEELARNQALQGVNLGTGESAVQSASAGIKAALEAAKAANREDIVGGAFSNIALGKVQADKYSQEAQELARYREKAGLSPGQVSTGGGRIYT